MIGAEQPHGQARARERLPDDELAIEAEVQADAAHFVLEQIAQRLDQLELHPLGQAADVVVALDDHRRAEHRRRLDDVRIERALAEEVEAAELVARAARRRR